jgi:hypothetical protein
MCAVGLLPVLPLGIGQHNGPSPAAAACT